MVYRVLRPIPEFGAVPGDMIVDCPTYNISLVRTVDDGGLLARLAPGDLHALPAQPSPSRAPQCGFGWPTASGGGVH